MTDSEVGFVYQIAVYSSEFEAMRRSSKIKITEVFIPSKGIIFNTSGGEKTLNVFRADKVREKGEAKKIQIPAHIIAELTKIIDAEDAKRRIYSELNEIIEQK